MRADDAPDQHPDEPADELLRLAGLNLAEPDRAALRPALSGCRAMCDDLHAVALGDLPPLLLPSG